MNSIIGHTMAGAVIPTARPGAPTQEDVAAFQARAMHNANAPKPEQGRLANITDELNARLSHLEQILSKLESIADSIEGPQPEASVAGSEQIRGSSRMDQLEECASRLTRSVNVAAALTDRLSRL